MFDEGERARKREMGTCVGVQWGVCVRLMFLFWTTTIDLRIVRFYVRDNITYAINASTCSYCFFFFHPFPSTCP